VTIDHQLISLPAVLGGRIAVLGEVIAVLEEMIAVLEGRIAIPPAMGKAAAVEEVMLAGMTHVRRMLGQSQTPQAKLHQDCLTRSTRNTN